jgi:hypothetical protein
MRHFVSAFLLLCWSLQAPAQFPPEGLAYPVEPLLQEVAPLPSITAEQLAKLPLDDPLLRLAYANFMASELIMQFYPPKRPIDYTAYPTWDVAALEDIKKRGDTVTPLLLDIAAKNPNSGFETGIIGNAPYVIKDLNPYLAYARNVLQTRTKEMNSSVAGTVAELLVRRGTPEDLERLRSLIKVRPYLTATIEGQLRHAAIFQAAKDAASDSKKATTTSLEPPAPKKAPEAKPTTSTPSEDPTSSTQWSIIAVLIVAALGLLWLQVKNRK